MPPQPEKKKKKDQTVDLAVEQGKFPVLFTFNRFGIEPLDSDDLLLHFGLNNSAGQVAAFALVLEQTHCILSLKSWSEYLEKVGAPKEEGDDSFRVTPSLLRRSFLPTANYTNWHRTGEMAEIRAFTFSMADVFQAATVTAQKVPAQSVALLRCSLELQRQLLFKIIKRVRLLETSNSEI